MTESSMEFLELPRKRGMDGDVDFLKETLQVLVESGRIVNGSVVVATGVNAQGQRETLGMDVSASEAGAFWPAFLRSLNARGLSGVERAISDAHQSLTLRKRGD